MAVKEVAKDAEKKMKDAVGYTKREFSSVRTGRASPALVEHIMVDYYGTPTQLKQLAAINTPDAKLIVIQPWDPSSIEAVEKAILQSNAAQKLWFFAIEQTDTVDFANPAIANTIQVFSNDRYLSARGSR